jgi:hypothetical protein
MLTKVLVGSGLLIGLYLILTNAPGAQRVIGAGGNLYAQGVKTLQGR